MFTRRSYVFGIAIAVTMCIGLSGGIALAGCDDDWKFTTDFRLEDCRFSAWGGFGKNPYFSLKPGYQLLLEGIEEGEDGDPDIEIRILITVLKELEWINTGKPDVGFSGWLIARVVEEREWERESGDVEYELVEVSKNFFARCRQTNAVYYFGEDVFEPDNEGNLVPADDAWRAGKDDAEAGLFMPGTFLLGSRYFEEQAPGVAMDRAEHVAMGLIEPNPKGGFFTGCVEVVDTNPLDEPPVCDVEDGDVKIYCPGVGLVVDEDAKLVDFGFNIFPLE